MDDDRGIRSEIKYLNEKVDLYHCTVMEIVKPVKDHSDKMREDIVSLKRDRYWLFTLCVTVFGGAIYAILDKLLK